MIHRDEWFATRCSCAFREVHAYKQRTRQAGPIRCGYYVDVVPAAFCLAKRRVYYRCDVSDVLARSDLWDDTAVLCMYLRLTRDDISAQDSVRVNDARCALVAGCFDP